ncbi:MAG: acyl-CoA dehydrogenase family protein [Pikeienuella sp.]
MQDQAEELHDAVSRWLAHGFPDARRAACVADRDGAPEAVWRDLAGLGVLGALAPEEAGGIDVSAAAIARIAEAFGRRLFTEPWTPVAVAATAVLREWRPEALPAIVAGAARPVLAWTEPRRRWARAPQATRQEGGRVSGVKTVVWGGARADAFILSACGEDGAPLLLLAPAAAATLRPYRSFDGCDAAEVVIDGWIPPESAVLARGGAAMNTLDRALDLAALAACGEALGAMERALELTLEHLRTRAQFGRPLAANQALRHRLADWRAEMELSRALVARAAREFETPARARLVAAAKHLTGETARLAANEGVQMHGGIGVTDEAEISRCHRRLMALDMQFGNAAAQLARFRAAG